MAHYAIGVLGMYWMTRKLGLSRMASVYASGTFFFSTWLALRVHSGHLTFLASAYMPFVVGLLTQSSEQIGKREPILAGAIVALMTVEGGLYVVLFTGFVVGALTLARSLQERKGWPLAAVVLMGVWGCGFSAVKLLPVIEYMRENPRHIASGGNWLDQFTKPNAGSVEVSGESGHASAMAADTSISEATLTKKDSPLSKWDWPAILIKAILGREQRSNKQYSRLQSWGWQEYGVYIGPLGVLLIALAPFLEWQKTWPWLTTSAFCFFCAAGNFGSFAPWRLMHYLPVLSSMQCHSRLLMPCIFTATVAAGYTLDALFKRAGEKGSWRGKLEIFLGILVAAALIDSVVVSRRSIRGTFPSPPPALEPRRPEIITIKGYKFKMAAPMLSNYCTADGYEPTKPKTHVTVREDPQYKGEYYFEPAVSARGGGTVELVRWTPNTMVVRALCPANGHIVLNRNWNVGWRAAPPYHTESFSGLISAPVEAGEHLIRFEYRPLSFSNGTMISLASFALAAGVLAWPARQEAGT